MPVGHSIHVGEQLTHEHRQAQPMTDEDAATVARPISNCFMHPDGHGSPLLPSGNLKPAEEVGGRLALAAGQPPPPAHLGKSRIVEHVGTDAGRDPVCRLQRLALVT